MAVSFTGQDLQNRSFDGQDLEGADFSYANLRGTDFTGANLKAANFRYSQIGIGNLEKLKRLLVLKLKKERIGFSFFLCLIILLLIIFTLFNLRFSLLTVVIVICSAWFYDFQGSKIWHYILISNQSLSSLEHLKTFQLRIIEIIFGALITIIMVVIASVQNMPILSLSLLIFLFIFTAYLAFYLAVPPFIRSEWYKTGIAVVSSVISSGDYELLKKDYVDFMGMGLIDFISDEVILVTTSFRNANLTDADFSYSVSYKADFHGAEMTRTNFKNTKYAVTRSDLVDRFHPKKEETDKSC